MTATESLSIVQVTPRRWDVVHEVNEYVERVSAELAERGHRVLIAAPSDSLASVRDSRRAISRARDDPASLLSGDGPRVLAVGAALPLPRGSRPRPAPLPVDTSRAMETLLGSMELDIVHVHEPYAPNLSASALRHSFTLNVGTFHEPHERLLSTQVARPLVELFFGRLDARTVSSQITGDTLERYFPGAYDLVMPGTDQAERSDRSGGPLRILFRSGEEHGALRIFLRALRKLPSDLDWRATVVHDASEETPLRVARVIRERIELISDADVSAAELSASHDIICASSGGSQPAPGLIRQGIACGAVPVVSNLPVYAELLGHGEIGLLFPVGDAETLSGQIARLGAYPPLLEAMRGRAIKAAWRRTWSDVADEVERIYRTIAARRHSEAGNPEIRRRISKRRLIEVDLHMHTDHSPDCATPVEVLLETARDRGLGAIAITDHNVVTGALAAREVAEQMGGIKVIVAEEVKTAEQGEVIGLFIEEKIDRGMTMAETIAEIRRQGGLVYVPHPFDRLHSVPDYEHLLNMVEEIDILEVFNPRATLAAFNEEAERFAAKYRIVPGAGSDSHVAQGLGSVRIRINDFDGPEEFLEAMRDADITRRHKNMAYVQALKFLQTTGRPKAPKRSVSGARPVKGGRPRRRSA